MKDTHALFGYYMYITQELDLCYAVTHCIQGSFIAPRAITIACNIAPVPGKHLWVELTCSEI